MKDFQEARNWLQKAADSGSAEAQYNLGVVFERGLGTPIDIELARKWYKEAASQGFDKAIEKLKN
jgi:TPR repeat protein